MNVIALEPRRLHQDGTWQSCELAKIQVSFASELATGDASGWHVSATEVGDPQFYLLGPKPDEDCILSISRLGRLYILEDGNGRVLAEDGNLARLTAKGKQFLREAKAGIIASLAMIWGTLRLQFEEKIEPVLAESEELLFLVAPKLAAFV
jgi:hypothetical protein